LCAIGECDVRSALGLDRTREREAETPPGGPAV